MRNVQITQPTLLEEIKISNILDLTVELFFFGRDVTLFQWIALIKRFLITYGN